MRKIIYYVATSADGFIARPDGSVEWLNRPMPKGAYGMPQFMASIDTVIMGRKTYEIGLKLGDGSLPGGVGNKNYVFSRRGRTRVRPGVVLVQGNLRSFAERLRRSGGKHVWLMGGAELVGAFVDAGQLDELIVHVVPILIGKGIPLIAPRHRSIELRLASSRVFPDGVVRLHYRLERQRAPKR